MIPSLRLFEPTAGGVKVDQIIESRISTVISMLPTSLQSRMGPIRSLRRSTSIHSLQADIVVDETSETQSDSGLAVADEPDACISNEELKQTAALRNAHFGNAKAEALTNKFCVKPESGIHWKFAHQGTSLVSISVGGNGPAINAEDVAFERKAFVDGITYLLRGLPHDLSATEIRQLRSALPDELAGPEDCSMTPPTATDVSFQSPIRHQRSILHRGVHLVALNLVLLLHFLMPYCMMLVKQAARLERKYKITEYVVKRGRGLVNAVGRQSVALTETVSDLNDGKVGQSLFEALAWTLDGVSQGISDGVGEGLVMVGNKGQA